MADRISSEHRSWNMSRIRQADTQPELTVRHLLHGMGYRYRLHRRDLPGSPDIVFPGRRKVIFVHGCFWHRHPDCPKAYTPKTRTDFWQTKFDRNVVRDARVESDLRSSGWDVMVVWECETKDSDRLRLQLTAWLGPPGGKKDSE